MDTRELNNNNKDNNDQKEEEKIMEEIEGNNNNVNESERRMSQEQSSRNVQATDDEEISANVAVTTNSHLTPSGANFFQACLRMAVAVFLTLWAISQSLFYIDRRLAITDSSSTSSSEFFEEFEDDFNLSLMNESSKKDDKKGENERIKKKTKKRKNKRREGQEEKNLKNSSSSSSSSRESSPEREEEEKKPSLKIDSNLLHTDTMPKISMEGLGRKKDEGEEDKEVKLDEKDKTPESPPIQIETIGVRMERRQQALESGQPSQHPQHPPPPFFMFKDAREEVEEDEEEDENQPIFGRLDAIAEEDSDELRSAQSSRASTARLHLRPSVSPPSEIKEEKKEEEDEDNEDKLPKMPFKFLFERQQSAGGSSQSSVAKVVELSSPEEEEDKISPKVPRLDLEGVSLETSEAEEEQTARDGVTPISDTDTIVINEEEENEDEEKNKIKTTKVTFEDEKEIFKTEKSLELEDELKREKEKKMYSASAMLYQHPSDADRDQGEVFASLADQHIPMPPPMEDGRLSSPSMSINLDRSRESLDHSICSIPTREVENISQEFTSLPSPILSSSTLVGFNGKDIGRDFDSTERNGANGLLTAGIGDIMSKKQSEKASSTSSSSPAYIQKAYEEEEEEPMPLPPPPSTTSNGSKLPTNHLPLNGSSFPISLRQEEPPPPPPLPTLPPVSSPESVLPLWGRNERLTSYLHGYGGTLPKKRQDGTVEGEGKENGIINGYVPPPSYKWLEAERKKMEERHKEEDRAWTIHPIALKERPTSRSTQEDKRRTSATAERNIPIKIHHDTYTPFSASTDWFNTRSPLHDSLWPQRNGFGGFQQSMSSSDLPPLPPLSSLYPLQQPPSLYGGSSAKPSPVPTAFASVGAFDHSFESSSRSDFMSASGGPTADLRAGRQATNIREIPIQRSASAFAPSLGGIMGSGVRPIGTTAAPPPTHNEYYRREVLTRTLVTRSTEALSAPPPLSRSPPAAPPAPAPLRPLDVDLPPRDQLSEEYWVRYSRNIEEEERRLRSEQEHRRRSEEERRLRVEEQRRRLEQQEQELVEKLRREREQLGKTLEAQMIDRERAERDRIRQDRLEREAAERRRREEWDRIERDRRAYEEAELEKRRELERIERERLERERLEAERLERERLERQKQELERIEKQRLEQERVERERLEIERLEIERIERIKREKREQEEREKERQRQEAARLQKVREELEKAERERLELERQARELYEREQREEAERQREREREAQKEAQRREEERLARERLERAEREAMEREIARRARERAEHERLEILRKEKERIEQEQMEAEKRERERLEQERREREMIEDAILARERRDQERREERERERQRQEEERLEQERRQRERVEAQQRERDRQMQEQQERDRLAHLEAQAAERRAHRALEERQQRERLELERRAEELREMERLEQEKRERERAAEELRLAELRDQEQRMAAERERERREAQEREERRQREGWRSREMLEQLARERDEKAAWEAEKRRLLEEHEIQERKRQGLTSKETLERLTRRPYYSRENLADYPDMTTKVERQVIERVDRTLWTDTTDTRPASHNGLTPLYYGGPSSNGMPPPLYGGDLGPPPTEGEDYTSGGREPSRLYQPRADEQDWLRRGASSRTSKYRQRMERARKEFITGTPSEYPPSSYDPLLDRYRKSTEDLLYGRRPPSEYRGPLLQRFNSGEFSHPPEPTIGLASGLGRSPYEQEDFHRSKSVLDSYSPTSRERLSRREYTEQESSHTRSKSADYLMDPRRPREEPTIPENDLQKGLLGEHELRFRKSTERMQVPDWYRDYYRQQQPPGYGIGPPSATTSGVFSAGTAPTVSTGYPYTRQEPPISSLYGKEASRPWQYTQQQPPPTIYGSPPLGGISFPSGMFDKYKEEIEDLRRSRGSLHQLGLGGERESRGTTATHPQEHTKQQQQPKLIVEGNTVTREYSREAFSKTEVQTLAYPQGSHQPGYTVSTVPSEWRMAPKERQNSRVVEVVDTFVDRPTTTDGQQPQLGKRYGGRVTLEEVLDSIFQSTQYIPDLPPADPSSFSESQSQFRNVDGPGIFTPNQALMEKLAEQPQLAEQLLRNEPIYVRCAHCQLIRSLPEARSHYCWCRHCYTYYCSRSCRQRDWERHRDKCSFARINSLCKEVIMKVRRDPETQFHMSRVAREGFRREGRGSVNIRLISAYSAQLYLEKGWQIFARHDPNQLLFYYPIQALIDQRKEPSLIQLCRKYNPNEKFILSVSIIADVEQCPETPPPLEPINNDKNNNFNKTREGPSTGFGQEFVYGTAVPTNV